MSGGIQDEYRANRPSKAALVFGHQPTGTTVSPGQRAHLRRTDRQECRLEDRTEERNDQYHRNGGDEEDHGFSVMCDTPLVKVQRTQHEQVVTYNSDNFVVFDDRRVADAAAFEKTGA